MRTPRSNSRASCQATRSSKFPPNPSVKKGRVLSSNFRTHAPYLLGDFSIRVILLETAIIVALVILGRLFS